MQADLLILQVAEAVEFAQIILRGQQHLLAAVVDFGEIHALAAFRRGRHPGNDHIDLSGLQGGQQRVEGQFLQFQLYAHVFGDVPGQIQVEPNDRILAVDHRVELEWRKFSVDSDHQAAFGLYFGQAFIGGGSRRISGGLLFRRGGATGERQRHHQGQYQRQDDLPTSLFRVHD